MLGEKHKTKTRISNANTLMFTLVCTSLEMSAQRSMEIVNVKASNKSNEIAHFALIPDQPFPQCQAE
jgi:hypothetical protein